MKAKVLLSAVLLVFAECGKKQEVLAVVLKRETNYQSKWCSARTYNN